MPGGAPGLQNQCGVDKVPGGFDSHSPPPFLNRRQKSSVCVLPVDTIIKKEGFMINKNTKILIFGLLVLFGAALLAYGAFFHSTNVSAQQNGQPVLFAKSESALIKDASVSGVKRDETGKIKQTYEIGENAPKACST